MRASITVALYLLLFTSTAKAESPGLGIGIIIFGPTGFSVNRHLSSENSVDAALAWDIDEVLHLHGDYLFKTKPLHQEGSAVLTAHYGLGARLRIMDEDGEGKGKKENRDRFGIRAPIGVDVWFPKPSLEFFAEASAIMDFVEKTDLSLDLGIGGRYYF